jgi:hypothetical protein
MEDSAQPIQQWDAEEAISEYNLFFSEKVRPNLQQVITNFKIIDKKNDPTRKVLEGMGNSTAFMPVLTLMFNVDEEEKSIDLRQRQAEMFYEGIFLIRQDKKFREKYIIKSYTKPKLNKINDEISVYYHFPKNELYFIYEDKYYLNISR